MDKRHVQGNPGRNMDVMGTPINPMVEQMNRAGQFVTSLDNEWDLGAAADDNEAYSIEEDQIQ